MKSTSSTKTTAKKPDILRHYTSIENLFKILESEELILGDPEKWPDKNDSAALQAFCSLKGNGTEARVVCFLDGEESISHWKTFAEKEGCCISFDRNEILKQVKGTKFLRGSVKYKREIKAEELKKLIPKNIKKIPFIKRNQYKCEKEYRIIWFGTGDAPTIPIEKAIKGITLSPWIPDIDREKIKKNIKDKCKYNIEPKTSRVLKLPKWISKFYNLGKRNSKKA